MSKPVKLLNFAVLCPVERANMYLIDMCKREDKEGLIKAIQSGVDVNQVDEKGRNCLHFASSMGRQDLVQLLISKGADVMAKDKQGNTPLHFSGHSQVVQLLYDYGAELNARNNHGNTAYQLMTRKGIAPSTLELMKNLLERDHHHSTSETSSLSLNQSIKPGGLLMEFCKDLGAFYVVLLLGVILSLSLVIAFIATGYFGQAFERIPIVDGETFHKEEL